MENARKEFRVRESAVIVTRWLNRFLLGFGLLMSLPSLIFIIRDFANPGIALVPFTIGALIVAGIVIFGLRSERRFATLRISLDGKGITYSVFNSMHQLNWQELESVQIAAVHNVGSGVTFYRFELRAKMMDSIQFSYTDKQITDIGQLHGEIERHFVDHHFESSRQLVKSGQILEFGPMKLSHHGIQTGAKELSFSEIDGIIVEKGKITYQVNGQRKKFGSETVGSIPNFCIYRKLLEEFV